MINILKSIIYQYYLFYKNILKDDDPAFLVLLLICAEITMPLMIIASSALEHYSGEKIGKLALVIPLIGLGLLYVSFYRTKKIHTVIKEKKLIGGSQPKSAIVAILSFITYVLIFFASMILAKYLG